MCVHEGLCARKKSTRPVKTMQLKMLQAAPSLGFKQNRGYRIQKSGESILNLRTPSSSTTKPLRT